MRKEEISLLRNTSGEKEADHDVPLEASGPEAACSLESILCTEELRLRPSRPPDYVKENRALVALSAALADSPRSVLQTLAETILEVTDADSSGLSLLTADGKRFYWPAIAGRWTPHVGGGTPRNFGPCGDVLDRNMTLLFRHFEQRYPYLLPVVPSAEECLLVPFYVDGRAVGTIWAIMHNDRRKFDAEDDRLMNTLGKFASSAYQTLTSIHDLKFQIAEREKVEITLRELTNTLETRVRVRTEELEQEIAERKRAEERLRRSEAYLTEAQRLSLTGSFGWKVSGGKLIWSKETFRILEYDETTEPTLELVLERVHPEDITFVREKIARATEKQGDFDFEHRLLMPDGSIKHVHVVARAVKGQAGAAEFVGAVMDITERKKSHDAMRAAKARFEGILAIAEDAVISVDSSQRIVLFNQGAERVFGYTQSEIIGKSLDILLPRRFASPHRRHLEDFVQSADIARVMGQRREVFGVRKNGQEFPAEASISKLHMEGELIFTAILRDITSRKQAAERIQQDERELRQIVEAIPGLILVLAPDGSLLYTNQRLLDHAGLTVEDTQTGDFRERVFYPFDVERLRHERREALARGAPFQLEQRMRGKDGRYRWFLTHYNPLEDEQGRIVRWYATGTDIDDRKRAEERVQDENLALREEVNKASMFEEIVGSSAPLRSVLSQVSKVARTDSTVLITGETGTGKELIARAIHKRSARAGRAFVSVNCSAVPTSLISAELFGHEKGAFTGALQRRLGRFELAQGGTLFLDEVGELPPEMQIALLRVLQEGEFDRVGGTQPIRADVRLIAATNRDLEAAILAGTFRSDLFYRFNVFPIEMPPLRARREDIRMLSEYFIYRYAGKLGKKITGISKETLDMFQSYAWPGNVRELQNVIERSLIVCDTDTFSVDSRWLARNPLQAGMPTRVLSARVTSDEKRLIEAALAESRGRVSGPSGAAVKLGLPASTLESKIRAMKINKHLFKSTQDS